MSRINGQRYSQCRHAFLFCFLQLLTRGVCSQQASPMAQPSATNLASQALAKLHDIHTPPPVGWWPLAPGWYVLSALLIIAVCVVVFFVFRRISNGRAKRRALQLLMVYEQQYQQEPNSQLTSTKISELLRRVALAYFPRATVASLQGEAWIAFLNETSKGLDFKLVHQALLDSPYQPMTSCDLQPLFTLARSWISQRRGPCLN